MESNYFRLLVFVYVAIVACDCHDKVNQSNIPMDEDYWKQTLGSTKMPKPIKNCLGGGGGGDGAAAAANDNDQFQIDLEFKGSAHGSLDIKDIASIAQSLTQPPVSTLANVAICMASSTAQYMHAQLHAESTTSLFFQEPSLKPGTSMTLDLRKSNNFATFIGKAVPKSILFNIDRIRHILTNLPINHNKDLDDHTCPWLQTISLCQQQGTKGRVKDRNCATSLESMVNFTMTQMGRHVRPLFTEVEREGPCEYKVVGARKLPTQSTIGCSKMSYPNAVFYCQSFPKTLMFMVTLTDDQQKVTKLPCLCHEDTSQWNPNSWIFQSLKCKPGVGSVCHFLASDDIAWVPNPK